ncbi:MAG: hypothetical protein ABSB70_18490 [Candidatus Velthaea sp.]|jgi:hypothetical protein
MTPTDERRSSNAPFGRPGEPRKASEVITLQVEGKSAFTTGQAAYFIDGWP